MNNHVKPVEVPQEQECEKQVCLAAFEDKQLSDEAAKQLAALRADNNRPMHKGQDLPAASRLDLLEQAKKS